jgi:hypothetical protein
MMPNNAPNDSIEQKEDDRSQSLDELEAARRAACEMLFFRTFNLGEASRLKRSPAVPEPGDQKSDRPNTLEELEADRLAGGEVNEVELLRLRLMQALLSRNRQNRKQEQIEELDRRYGSDWLERLQKLDLDTLLAQPESPAPSEP